MDTKIVPEMSKLQDIVQEPFTMSNMKFSRKPKKTESFQLRSDPGTDSCYVKLLNIDCKKSKLHIKINDYKCQSYLHLTRHDTSGSKVASMTLRPDELYNILDNREILYKYMKECDDSIVKHFNVLPGTLEQEVESETIPVSQRNMEMEKQLQKSKEERKLFEEFVNNREEILSYKRKKEAEEKCGEKCLTIKRPKKTQEEQEEEDFEEGYDDEEEEDDEDDQDEASEAKQS